MVTAAMMAACGSTQRSRHSWQTRTSCAMARHSTCQCGTNSCKQVVAAQESCTLDRKEGGKAAVDDEEGGEGAERVPPRSERRPASRSHCLRPTIHSCPRKASR